MTSLTSFARLLNSAAAFSRGTPGVLPLRTHLGHRTPGPVGGALPFWFLKGPEYLELYRKNLEDGNDPWKAMNFESRDEQRLMFKVFTDEIDFDGCSVLDVGCGTGNFALHLKNCRMVPSLLRGIDPIPEFVEEAQRIAPPWAEYAVKDPVAQPRALGKGWDWIVISGVVQNFPPRQAKRLLADCWRTARYGIAFSFLPLYDSSTDKSWQRIRPMSALNPDDPDGGKVGWLYEFRPSDLVEWAYELGASDVQLRSDYLGDIDATIIMRREGAPAPPSRSPVQWLLQQKDGLVRSLSQQSDTRKE